MRERCQRVQCAAAHQTAGALAVRLLNSISQAVETQASQPPSRSCQHVPMQQAAHPVLRSTISHSTPAGKRPASAAMSTAASVCPRRFSTPPSRARSVATCPGRLKSAARAAGSASARQVAALQHNEAARSRHQASPAHLEMATWRCRRQRPVTGQPGGACPLWLPRGVQSSSEGNEVAGAAVQSVVSPQI